MLPGAPDASIPLPACFFADLLPAITDLSELRVTLMLHFLVATGTPLIEEEALARDPTLRRGIVPPGSTLDPGVAIRRGLERALTRGSLLAVQAADSGDERRWYTVNSPAGRELIHDLEQGQQALADLVDASLPPVTQARPTIFRLYERHIAVLTPLVAQQLAAAADEYPYDWITDAFDEAVARDRRSWRFVRYLLERWAREGKDDATDRRRAARPLDPDKYTKGKYAPLFQR